MKDNQILKNKIVVAAASLFAFAMVMFPAVTETGSKTAIIIWANSIVPVLLPFFIFSEFIKRTGNLQSLPPRIYPFVIAFLSGYPMGAKVVGDFVKDGKLTVKEGKWVLSYSLVTGPAFIIFTIGTFIGSTKAAVVVAVAHYLGGFFNGFLHYCREPREKNVLPERYVKSDYMENFTYAIGAGFKGMAMILAYLMFFTIGINLLESMGMFEAINNEVIASGIKGMFEMTIGINLVGMCNIGIKLKTILASALVSFGGFSVVGQSMSMARGSGIGLKEILEIKLTHGMFAAIIATLIAQIYLI